MSAWILAAWLSAWSSASPEVREVPVQRPSDPVSLVFDWRAPAACPDRERLLTRLATLLPALPDELPSQGTAELRVVARVEPGQPGESPWMVELELTSPDGSRTRRFGASDCEDAAAAAVLVVAVALDPVLVATRLAEASEPAPEPEPELEPEPEPELEPAVAPEPELPRPRSRSGEAITIEPDDEPRARPPRFGLRVFGTGGWGPTNTGFGGIGGSFAVFDRLWRWELAAGWSIPRVVRLADDRGGSFDGWWLGTRGCFVPELRAFEFPLCPGIELGQVRGRGLPPTDNPERASIPWIAPVLGQGFTWSPIDRLALGIDLALVVPIGRGSFVIDEREVQRLPLVGARALLGVELRLP
ncbi:hypothetical protein ACNOYE_18760 [Nannocystaceae bacterium ST9]